MPGPPRGPRRAPRSCRRESLRRQPPGSRTHNTAVLGEIAAEHGQSAVAAEGMLRAADHVTLMTLIWPLRERRERSILQHPIDVQVDVLVVEAEQVFDLRALGNWGRITPHDVLDELVAYPRRPVARYTFIRASRGRLGGLEQIHAYIQLRNVIAGRQPSLEEEDGPASFTHRHAVDLHTHVPRAVDRVNSCVRISRVNKDLLILFEPRVHLIPVKSEVIF